MPGGANRYSVCGTAAHWPSAQAGNISVDHLRLEAVNPIGVKSNAAVALLIGNMPSSPAQLTHVDPTDVEVGRAAFHVLAGLLAADRQVPIQLAAV